MSEENVKLEVKKLQYQRASEDLRYFASLTWKVPSIAVAIVTALIGISSQNIFLVNNGFPILIGIVLLVSLSRIIVKYRLFEEKSATVMKQLEQEFEKSNNLKVNFLPVQTPETLVYVRNWNKKNHQPKMSFRDKLVYARAYDVLQISIWVFTGLLVVWSIWARYFPFNYLSLLGM